MQHFNYKRNNIAATNELD